ncbi:class I SAM-dependent methyltransferase [Streptomyces sp. NPDC091292]|uniref:class I SAM-dependent methyltransferase n=1 Tax=Streptomyces sp. NPDC091292 TaxID=3365991 RepID=UPI0038161B87
MAHQQDVTPHRHHHPHHGDDHTPMDWVEMAPLLERNAEISAPMYTRAAAWLAETRPAPRRIVDAGSGPGVVACLLAEVFPGADVVAVDAEEALLERARARAERTGLGDRVRTLRAELPSGLDTLDPADLLWVGKSLHHVGDQRAGLTALAGLLAPGGLLALLEGGLPPRCLPRDIGIGRPGLQSRLDAAEDEAFTEMRAALPGAKSETEDWPALLTAAGLRPSGTRTFLTDLPAPLSGQARDHVVATYERRRDAFADRLADDDRATLDRLLDPADPASLHRRPDVFLLGAQTFHTAVKDG